MPPILPDTLLSELSGLLAERIGLHFPKERWGDLDRGIVAAARVFGKVDAPVCARWLLSAPLTRTQIEILAGHLTVGETYFFREKRSFEVLEQHILPALLHTRAEKQLRIWSAGCCTGEEPYSISMLLDRLIPSPETWNITLLATDINPEFLRKAREGVYSDWSFRDTPDWFRERYFNRGKNASYEVHELIRKRVTFAYLNFADDVYPSVTNNTHSMDVIFCRNVLMYFSAERAKKAVENLYRSLLDGGWLIVSPTETSNSLFSAFTAVEFPGVVLYQKRVGVEPRIAAAGYPIPVCVAPPGNSDLPLVSESIAAEVTRSVSVNAPPPEAVHATTKQDDSPNSPAFMARACANQGQLTEAVKWCEQAIAADKLNPVNQYLLATIQQELGWNAAAMQSLQRALYLDPDFVLAHFVLGNLCQLQGRRHEAERYFDNALALLHAFPHDAPLPESEELTAGRLMEIITSMRSNLPRAAIGPTETME